MIRRPRGRPAWSDAGASGPGEGGGMRSWRTWRGALGPLLVLPLAGACKKKGPRPGEGAGGGAAGLGEEGLTGSGSSLERAKRGLGPEENGGRTGVAFAC